MLDSWICDFCSARDPGWLYRAKNIEFKHLDSESIGGWAACQACHELIERGSRQQLTDRTTAIMCRRHPEFERGETAREIQYLHDRFFAHRIAGPPVLIPRKNGALAQ